MGVEIAEIKEALEQLVLKEPYFLNRIIKISVDNITTKDDLKILVELINKRFEDMNKRFESMGRRFEDMQLYMDKRFEDMNKRFEEMQKYMEKRFESMDNRFHFMIRLMIAFNVPLLVSMIGLLLKLLFTK